MISFSLSDSMVALLTAFEFSDLRVSRKLFIMSGQQRFMWHFKGSKSLNLTLHFGQDLSEGDPGADGTDEVFIFDSTTWEEAPEGNVCKDDEEQGLVSEMLALVFGFFGLTLFTLEVEGCFNPKV